MNAARLNRIPRDFSRTLPAVSAPRPPQPMRTNDRRPDAAAATAEAARRLQAANDRWPSTMFVGETPSPYRREPARVRVRPVAALTLWALAVLSAGVGVVSLGVLAFGAVGMINAAVEMLLQGLTAAGYWLIGASGVTQ